MQAKITDLESQVSEAVRPDTTRAGDASTIESSSVTKKLDEELKKRDALIEVRLTLDCIYIGVCALWLNH